MPFPSPPYTKGRALCGLSFLPEEEDNVQDQLDSPHRAGPRFSSSSRCHLRHENQSWRLPSLGNAPRALCTFAVPTFAECLAPELYFLFCCCFFWQHVFCFFFGSILINLLLLTNILLNNLSGRIRVLFAIVICLFYNLILFVFVSNSFGNQTSINKEIITKTSASSSIKFCLPRWNI